MMEKNRKTDEQIRRMAAEEPWSAPESCIKHVEHILGELPDAPAKEEKMRKIFRKRTIILAAALAALAGTTALASGLFQWNEKAVENFGDPTEDEQDTMTMNGIAREQKASVTDAGITITAEQTVQDKNTLYILLDIQAEGAIIDGNGGFDNPDENGEYGSPWIVTREEDAFNNVSMGFSPDTPAFGELSDHGYYELSALKSLDKEWTEDSVTVNFTEYSYYTYENGDTIPHKIKGEWTLTLPLGSDTELKTSMYEPEQPVDISGIPVKVKRVELSPLSLRLVYDMDDWNKLQDTLYAGETDVIIYEAEFAGFLNRNGEEIHTRTGGRSGKYDFEKREVIQQIGLGKYVDIEEISAVLLGEEKVQILLQ